MSISRLIRTVQLALKSLLLHKLRSALTMLGIVFGVFSVIAMLAIGQGASAQAQKQVLKLGATNVIVRSLKPPDDTSTSRAGSNSFTLDYGLKREDLERLKKALPNAVDIVPVRERKKEARYRHRTLNVRVVGCTPRYFPMNQLRISSGRLLSDSDEHISRNVAVIADDVAAEMFKEEYPIGKSIDIDRTKYTIVGVTRRRTASAGIGGSLSAQDYNKDIYIPYATFGTLMTDLDVRFVTGSFSIERVELNQITIKFKDKSEVVRNAEVIRETLEYLDRKDPKRDHNHYAIVVPLELLKQADQIRRIFDVVLGSIALISLVVGGIGIMNIMLATVTERTREIGVRRALGARQHDITVQFLTETVVLSGTGGVVGVLLGVFTPYAFGAIQWIVKTFILEESSANSDIGRMFSEMRPEIALWSLPVAFGIAVGIGIIFGLYPARAAARLDPIEALRHE